MTNIVNIAEKSAKNAELLFVGESVSKVDGEMEGVAIICRKVPIFGESSP